MSGKVVWRLDEAIAQLKTDHLELQLNITRPQDGLRSVKCNGQCWSSNQFLGIAIPGLVSNAPVAVNESYVRGTDLVVRYGPTAAERFSPQVHWRFQAADQAVGVEVIISMQTDLLDSRPTVESASSFLVGQLLGAAEGGASFRRVTEPGRTEWSISTPVLLFRPSDASSSYIEMAYPSDVAGFWMQSDEDADRHESGFRLLHQHLEKGVIRRLRVAGWFVPRDGDCQRASQLFRRLVQSSPPLTS